MAESKRPAQKVRVDYLCDECGEPMEIDKKSWGDLGALTTHECKNGHRVGLNKKYPHFIWE